VVVDRFLDSSLAYQGGARGLGVDAVLELNRAVIGGLDPARTFLLRVPVDVALARVGGERRDRIEAEGADFLARVDRAFEALSVRFDRVEAIDGTRSQDVVADEIAARLGLV
jgi:dTMP kinase